MHQSVKSLGAAPDLVAKVPFTGFPLLYIGQKYGFRYDLSSTYWYGTTVVAREGVVGS